MNAQAAENSHADSCFRLSARVYGDEPYFREVGRVGEAAGVATSAGVMEGHDVPPDVTTEVVHWLRKGGHPYSMLNTIRFMPLEGGPYCVNEGCSAVGQLKELFKVCPQCKTTRYCWRRVSETALDCWWVQRNVLHRRRSQEVPTFKRLGNVWRRRSKQHNGASSQ
jgi:hypothetical protein